MLNPRAKPFVLNKPKTFVYNKLAEASQMIQSYYPPPSFSNYPPLYPYPNTITYTINNNPVYLPYMCHLFLPPHPPHRAFTSKPRKENSGEPTTRKMIQVKCTKVKFDGVFEVNKGPIAFGTSTFGVETKSLTRHVCVKKKKPGSVFMWRPKGNCFDFVEQQHQLKGETTVMVKNIPNKLSKKVLLEYLDYHCCEENEKISIAAPSSTSTPSEYDFVYLPMDFRSGYNLGYAFVNFTSAVAAIRFYRSFNKHGWQLYSSAKICEITLAKIQGKEQLIRHFRHSWFWCHTDEFLPTVFNPPRHGAATFWESATSPKAYAVGRRRGRGFCVI